MGMLEALQKKQAEPVKRLTVGPVPCHPEMLKILGQQFFSTRDSFFVEIMMYLQGFLQESVGTKENFVILEHGSGSSGLCAIGNHLLKPKDQVLCLNTGKFGERWVKIAQKRNCVVTDFAVDWKKAVDWAEVGQILQKEKPVALLMQHSETSTGSVHSLSAARKTIETYSPDTLLVVDAISSWGSLPIDMDQNKLDVVVGCSQKGFMLPTGLHFLCFSKKALAVIEKNTQDGFVTDFSHSPLVDIREQLKGKPRFSMDSNSLMALVYLKEEIIEKIGGWKKWFEDVHQRAEKMRAYFKTLGLVLFSAAAGDAVMALDLPAPFETKDVRKRLTEFGFEVNKSQDETKFTGIRIGNMGYITDEDVEKLYRALSSIFKK